MKCPHCKKELGNGDVYDLMTSHKYDCNSKVGKDLIVSEQASQGHGDYCTCEDCI